MPSIFFLFDLPANVIEILPARNYPLEMLEGDIPVKVNDLKLLDIYF